MSLTEVTSSPETVYAKLGESKTVTCSSPYSWDASALTDIITLTTTASSDDIAISNINSLFHSVTGHIVDNDNLVLSRS